MGLAVERQPAGPVSNALLSGDACARCREAGGEELACSTHLILSERRCEVKGTPKSFRSGVRPAGVTGPNHSSELARTNASGGSILLQRPQVGALPAGLQQPLDEIQLAVVPGDRLAIGEDEHRQFAVAEPFQGRVLLTGVQQQQAEVLSQ